MAWREVPAQPVPMREAFGKLTVDQLKPLLGLLPVEVPRRKGELVGAVVGYLGEPKHVKELYGKLEPQAQRAVREAAHDPDGRLVRARFEAKHGPVPAFHKVDEGQGRYRSHYETYRNPTPLSLFFPWQDLLPADLRKMLLEFVPAPEEFRLPSLVEPPAALTVTYHTWRGTKSVTETEEVPLRVRHTALEAEHDFKAVLRLVEGGKVRVSDKKKHPTAATVRAVGDLLQGGDFYTAEDQDEDKDDPAGDLSIKAFAWPMLLQAAGLVQKAGDSLKLQPAGRKALSRPASGALRAAWKKWLSTTLLDEFSRVEAVRGQNRAGLSALAARRKTVAGALAQCPAGRWVSVGDFFRVFPATGRDFVVSHRPYELYIAEHYYGNLGYDSDGAWQQLQGRYVLAFLFEYAATLGLIDVAYAPPQNFRGDYTDRWGTDDMSCLSRYDGLAYFRVNALGAWCLGLAEDYQAPEPVEVKLFQVLPNMDVVVAAPPLPAADRLFLERFAAAGSAHVWKLDRKKLAALLEQGFPIDQVRDFLVSRGAGPLPATVATLLDDLEKRAGELRDAGTARVIECRDPAVALLLASDPQFKGKCRVAGENWLVFRLQDEAAVRRGLQKLGYILPASPE